MTKRALLALMVAACGCVCSAEGKDWNYRFEKLLGTSGQCLSFADGSVVNINDPAIEVPRNRAFVRVGYWGDPATVEREFAISLPILSWDGGALTGLSVPRIQQRGYHDLGPEVAASLVQIDCASGSAEVGAVINSYWFTHRQPIQGGGPQLSFGQKNDFPIPISQYSSGSELVIQGLIQLPHVYYHEPGAIAQVVLVYYMQPLLCPRFASGPCPAATLANRVPSFGHVIALYDSRPSATTGTYREFAGHDTYTAFFSSPVADRDPIGAPLKFLEKSRHSSGSVFGGATWTGYRFFRVHVDYRQMESMIAYARATVPELWDASASPDDWGIILVSGLVEISNNAAPQCQTGQGAAGCNDVVIGASMSAIDAYRAIPIGGPNRIPDRRTKDGRVMSFDQPDPGSEGLRACVLSRRCLGD